MAEFEHYFTAQPAGEADLRTRIVHLAGEDVEVVVASGIFSPDGIDRGTAVLLAQVPAPPPAGTFLDLGCGWGPIALTLGRTAPEATVWAVDVNERALDLLRRNAARLGLDNVRVARPDAVPPTERFDLIWSAVTPCSAGSPSNDRRSRSSATPPTRASGCCAWARRAADLREE